MSIKYDEVKDGELFKFEKPGTVLEGIYMDHREQQTSKGMGQVYDIKTKEGTMAFFASSNAHQKLKDLPKGCIVRVEFEKVVKTNSGNEMKIFKVGHAEANEANLNALGITILQEEKDEIDAEAEADKAFKGV